MTTNGEIYLGGILLSAFGRRLRKTLITGGREDRASGGALYRELTYEKYVFELPYEVIDGDALDAIIDLYRLHQKLELRIYEKNNSVFLNEDGEIPVVIIDPVQSERVLLNPELWSGVSLTLKEV